VSFVCPSETGYTQLHRTRPHNADRPSQLHRTGINDMASGRATRKVIHDPVTAEVAGSSPVVPATDLDLVALFS
jgi:hypothetical protein